MCVCLSVRDISGTAGAILTKFYMPVPCGRGSVLLRRRYATLCAFGFMDDVTFGRNGRDAGKGRQPAALSVGDQNTCATGAESDVCEAWLQNLRSKSREPASGSVGLGYQTLSNFTLARYTGMTSKSNEIS